MKNALFSNRSIVAPISFGIGLFLLLTVLVNPITVFASSGSSFEIPYNVSEMATYNLIMLEDPYLDQAITYALSNNFIDSDDALLVYTNDGFYSNKLFQYIFIVNPYCEENVIDNFDFSSSPITFKSDQEIFTVIVHYSSGASGSSTQHLYQASLMGTSQSVTTSRGSYLPRYPFYYNGDPIMSANGKVVLIANGTGSLATGSAVAPSFGAGAGVGGSDFLGSGADFGASISSSTLPSSPTYNTYNFTTYNPPSFDDSSVLDALSSIYDILIYTGEYLVTNIAGAIKTLGDNIVILGNYIGDLLKYLVRTIITNIQNGIQNLYENIVALFEPVLKAFQEIINLGLDSDGNFSLTTLFVNLAIPDSEDLQDAIEDSDTFGLINVASSVNSKILSEVNTLKGLSSSKIIHVPSCYFHGVQIGDYDIDFSWYDNYKTFGDGIISAFLVWNYIWFLFFRFPSYIRGQGGAFVSDINSAADYGKH